MKSSPFSSGVIVLSQMQIKRGVRACANYIRKTAEGSPELPVALVGILTGAAYFAVDLSRELIGVSHTIHFVSSKSYDGRKQSDSSQIKIDPKLKSKLSDHLVFVLDELFDSGKTLRSIRNGIETLFEQGNLPSIHTITLMFKNTEEKKKYPVPDFYPCEVPDYWLVGYGLDNSGLHRNMLEVWGLPKEE